MIEVLIGLAAGIISGMGIGGGAILIPALIFLLGTGQQETQAVNLIYFLPTAVVALMGHCKNGLVEKRYLKPLIGFGVVGAVIGSLVALSINGMWLRKLFALFLLVIGVRELRAGKKR